LIRKGRVHINKKYINGQLTKGKNINKIMEKNKYVPRVNQVS